MGERSEPQQKRTLMGPHMRQSVTERTTMQTQQQDDLSDVALNVPLVSDDPRDWVVPLSAARYPDLMDWWDDLVATDGYRLPFSSDKADLLIYLSTQYEILCSETHDGVSTVPVLARIRSLVRSVLHEGLTIHQAGVLLGVNDHQVVYDLYCNVPNFGSDDVEARLCAERMLRNGCTSKEVQAATGLSDNQVSSFSAAINVPILRTGTVNCPKPSEAREIAMRMREQGFANSEISAHLASVGYDVRPATISQWWSRRKGGVTQ